MPDLYVGVMSGTSLDGVDVVLVELDDNGCVVHAAATTPYPPGLRSKLSALVRLPRSTLLELGTLNVEVGEFCADCIIRLIDDSAFEARQIAAVGLSGHTAFHQPEQPQAFTLQLGNPNTVAAMTAMTVVADIRGMDVALGGQGAPMVAPFHAWRFADAAETRVVVNIGGIANLTCLDPRRDITGFDSGPGNALMNAWCEIHQGESYDRNGEWAASGEADSALLAQMLSDPYFTKKTPKSTGLEHFNVAWLKNAISTIGRRLSPADVQATLLDLTVQTVSEALIGSAPDARRAILCGGGAYNGALVARLRSLLHVNGIALELTSVYGIEPEWVEAAAFAWLARRRLKTLTGNAPSVTGARQAAVLGGVYWGHQQQY